MTTQQKPRCKLIDADGNVFNLAGLVRQALRQAGQYELASQFVNRLQQCKSYSEALALMKEYVEVY